MGKNAYENKVPIYSYKNGVEIPPIGYVDDVLTMAKCGNSSVINNAIVNSFTESKKLKYGWGKCKQMHVGKTNNIWGNFLSRSENLLQLVKIEMLDPPRRVL